MPVRLTTRRTTMWTITAPNCKSSTIPVGSHPTSRVCWWARAWSSSSPPTCWASLANGRPHDPPLHASRIPRHVSRFTFHTPPAEANMKLLLRLIPWCFVALFGCEIVAVMMPKKDGEYHAREFGRLPVLLSGRIQPFDSVARNSLLQIRSTGDVPLEVVPSWQFWHHPKKLKSTEWLLEVMTRPEVADTRPVFLIHHAELLGELKLQDKGIDKSGLRYYTFNDLKPLLSEINEQARKAGNACPLNDGAAALLVMSEEKAKAAG